MQDLLIRLRGSAHDDLRALSGRHEPRYALNQRLLAFKLRNAVLNVFQRLLHLRVRLFGCKQFQACFGRHFKVNAHPVGVHTCLPQQLVAGARDRF